MSDSCDPMDRGAWQAIACGILQARILEWIAISFSRSSQPQELNPGLLHCRQMLYQRSYKGSPDEV